MMNGENIIEIKKALQKFCRAVENEIAFMPDMHQER
jgi:hypothetical protein